MTRRNYRRTRNSHCNRTPYYSPAPTPEQISERLGTTDETTPQFIFSCTTSALLHAIAAGMIDPVELARAELRNRYETPAEKEK